MSTVLFRAGAVRAEVLGEGDVVALEEDFIHPALPAGHPLGPHCLYRLSRERWTRLTGPAP